VILQPFFLATSLNKSIFKPSGRPSSLTKLSGWLPETATRMSAAVAERGHKRISPRIRRENQRKTNPPRELEHTSKKDQFFIGTGKIRVTR
jgi:hypothetical protein